MNTTPQPPNNDTTPPPQPVAYDLDGRPLYAMPPNVSHDPQQQPASQFVHVSRAVSPIKQEISPELKAKHDESAKAYPALNISEEEYILSEVRRHPIGLVIPVSVTIFFVALIASFLINYQVIVGGIGLVSPPSFFPVFIVGFLLILLFLIGGYVAVWVYMNNKFFLTNESVIQEIQTSLFDRKEQTVSLANIEDASFDQKGIIAMMFDYGSIRLSTEGDETTYRFYYVAHPKQQIALLNNAVEAFKNGRPVENLSDN